MTMLHSFALLIFSLGPSRVAGKASKPLAGSQKCEKGLFGSLVKDATVPLCDAHFPDDKAKSGWLVLFYRKEADKKLQDVMNRIAVDLGNEPPEKSKSLKKVSKKQRARLKDLAEKYEFEVKIPKKGLEERGKEALLKVGAVCCDCGGEEEQTLCKDRESGIVLVRPKMDEKLMPGGDAIKRVGSTEKIMKWTMGQLGFVKGQEADVASDAKGETKQKTDKKSNAAEGKADNKEELTQKLDELKATKAKAVADEDFKGAAKLKKEIAEVEARIEALPEAEDEASLQQKLNKLKEEKKAAAADEDYDLAAKLKKEIAEVEARLEALPKVEDQASLEEKLKKLKEEKKTATADEDYDLAAKLKKEVAEVEARLEALPKVEDQASLEEKLKKLKEEKAAATAEENYKLAGKLKKDIAAIESRLKGAEL